MKKFIRIILITSIVIFLSACAQNATIIFESEGGEPIPSLETAVGQTVSLPVPSREGYIFAGWFTGNGPNDAQFSSQSIVSENLKLYARWEENPFEYEVRGDEITIIGSNRNVNHLFIPEFINGYVVTAIGPYAFENERLRSLILPESIKTIGEGAFRNTLLTSLVIPKSVTEIGESAFQDNLIGNLTILDGLTTIGDYAFQNNLIGSLTIPDSVTFLGVGAFRNNQLTSVVLSKNITKIETVVFQENQLKSIIIPDNVTVIAMGSFQLNQLTSVTIPQGVLEINFGAFGENPLTDVKIIGDGTRFNDTWTNIGFPKEIMPE